MTSFVLTEQQLKAICNTIADTDRGLSKSEIQRVLLQVGIVDIESKPKTSSGYWGPNKRTWLYENLANEFNTSHNQKKIACFIEAILDPVSYTAAEKRGQYEYLFEEMNKCLLLAGYEVMHNGRLTGAKRATTLDEVDQRVNHLKAELDKRNIHAEVRRYCTKDLLRKDYYDTVFEAAKGIEQRLRDMTSLTSDGSKLVQEAINKKDPYIGYGGMLTDTDWNEYNGIKELIMAIIHLVRNPAAHTPKLNWKSNEEDALNILSMISTAHRYLDECFVITHS